MSSLSHLICATWNVRLSSHGSQVGGTFTLAGVQTHGVIQATYQLVLGGRTRTSLVDTFWCQLCLVISSTAIPSPGRRRPAGGR